LRRLIIFILSDIPLDENELLGALQDPGSGCSVVFAGRVRNDDRGREVAALQYDAYPALCRNEGNALVEQALRLYDVRRVVLAHRYGLLEIGDTAAWIGVAATHREAAFRACRYLIEAVKHSLPVWKNQIFADGGRGWVEPAPAAAIEPGLSDYGERQRAVPGVGRKGEADLAAASVMVVGAGGLGGPALRLLAGAGVGRIGICDPDEVSARDLHRQTIYDIDDVGSAKAEIAARRVHLANPAVEAVPFPLRIDAGNATELLRGWDLALDSSDNLPTKYMLNDASRLLGLPVVHAAVHHWEGQALLVDPSDREAGCLRCLWPEIPAGEHGPTGALGPVTSTIASMQASLALQYLLGQGAHGGRLRLLDLKEWRASELVIARDPGCPACGDHPSIVDLNPSRYA